MFVIILTTGLLIDWLTLLSPKREIISHSTALIWYTQHNTHNAIILYINKTYMSAIWVVYNRRMQCSQVCKLVLGYGGSPAPHWAGSELTACTLLQQYALIQSNFSIFAFWMIFSILDRIFSKATTVPCGDTAKICFLRQYVKCSYSGSHQLSWKLSIQGP